MGVFFAETTYYFFYKKQGRICGNYVFSVLNIKKVDFAETTY